MRKSLIQFLIQSAQVLEVSPIVKYTALSFFADRFVPTLSRVREGDSVSNWLLHPLRESNLQLFSLVCIWISSKIHDSRPLSVKSLKSLGDRVIKEQHFTNGDFLEAIGAGNIAFVLMEDLFFQLKEVAKVGGFVSFEACMEILDLLYEKDETWTVHCSPRSLAASTLVASYVITVPRQRWEFPILPWVRFVTGCKEDEILKIVRDILKHVFDPTGKAH